MPISAAAGKIISRSEPTSGFAAYGIPNVILPGLAIAPKIEDGDDKRARPVVAVEILRQLGILSAEDLADVSPMAIKNRRGDIVGQVTVQVDINLS